MESEELGLPASTILIVFGSWAVLLLLTLLYYFVWSVRGEDR
ncbi:MAG: hypothetical protein R3E12_11690 [Candidatus Eisenbacteria bacterium]